ncbi:LamG-like jellyroll fold domain-containing protein [Rubinisphaera brasiliensis]|uniref:FecR protein n=1 Tax=Rubinisphaera brasiliensis (strain ATCC 49424 / DSM 5305 / JCM 21570 / IAM 15109 / NBRC 103401 / IFAM 1448) TaxID=756272 RepID=F0SGH7_RUBBR|nr:LamG-like jellyroll fold domain-containing protein [Rubinisphaera brasiliensis]ADY60576.1 FecR protein [Rubinisphaera brasiliensis DSM 5305]
MSHNHEELEELLSRLNGPDFTAEDLQTLASILRNDPIALDCYLDHVEMEAMLRETYGLLHHPYAEHDRQTARPVSPRKVTRSRFWAGITLTAALLVAAFTFWPVKPQPAFVDDEPQSPLPPAAVPLQKFTQSDETVCTISHRTEAELYYRDGNREIRVQATALPAGQFRLENGIMGLAYANGANVILQAPVQFQVLSEQHLFVDNGRVNLHCPTEDSRGFVIETPSGVATDLGTEFAVHVKADRAQEDEFHVFQGEVALKSKLTPYELNLTDGMATRLDHDTATPAGIDVDHNRFIRSFESVSSDYYDQIMRHEPELYYVMADVGDGRTLRNEAENGYDAKIFNPYQRVLHWGPGFNGGTALRLDGMRSRVYAVAPDFPKPEGDHLTVIAWVFAESRVCWGSIAKNWEHGPDPARRGQFHFGLFEYSGMLEASINDKDNNEIFAIDSVPLPLNQWHHVAFVVDDGALRLYRNGSLVAETPCNGLNGNQDIRPLAIGTKLGNDSRSPAVKNNGFWDGRIDHLALFHQSLTTEEIRQLFDTGVRSALVSRSDFPHLESERTQSN